VRGIGWFGRFRARERDERGFTLVEVLVASTILAIGAFSVVQALSFGLKTTAISRQRTQAEALIGAQMESFRSLSYASVGLTDASLSHSSDTNNPDYWVNSGAPTYDADGAGAQVSYEPLVTSVSGGLPHLLQNVGGLGYNVYEYVTWVDMPGDGLGGYDSRDGDGDGIDDSHGHDAKRVTIVVSWTDRYRNRTSQYKETSLFSIGHVPGAHTVVLNQAPTVACPTPLGSSGSRVNNPVSFTVVATDVDGTVQQIDWNFGDGTPPVTNGGAVQTHTFPSSPQDGNYTITNTATDDLGLTGTNASLICTVYVHNPVNTNEVQTVTISSGTTGGTFTLTFNGQTTAAIAWNAPATGAGSVRRALNQLSNIAPGDVGVQLDARVYTITFTQNWGYQDVPQMTCTSSLTGTGASCTVVTTVPGENAGGAGGGSTLRPTGSIVIAGGAAWTNAVVVPLTLSATPGTGGQPITEMRFGEDGENWGCNWGSCPAYATSSSYTFNPTTTQGTRYVYVQFKDSAGHVSDDLNDTIGLDTVVPPTFTISVTRPTQTSIEVACSTGCPPTDPAPSSGTLLYNIEWRQPKTTGTWVSTSCPVNFTSFPQTCSAVPKGNADVRVRVQDPAGNQNYSGMVTINI